MTNITIVYNRFDITAVISAAFLYSYYRMMKHFDYVVKAISNDSSEEFLVTEDPKYHYLFIGISKVGKRFIKTNHTLIVNNDEDNMMSQIYHMVKGEQNEDSVLYKKLCVALDRFYTDHADESEVSLCLDYYLMSLNVFKDETEFRFIDDYERDSSLFKSFVKELKRKFSTNFTRNNPLTFAEGIIYPSATISGKYSVWVARFMKLSYKHYLNIVSTSRGIIVDSDIPGIEKQISEKHGYVMAYHYN